MNMAITLKASKREDLTRSKTKQSRNEGQIPAVVYGKDKETTTVSVDNIDLLKTLRNEGRNAIITLDIENAESVDVMLHEYQTDSIKDTIIHADFYIVDMSEEMEVSVPIRIEGEAAGVKDGGIMQQPEMEVLIKVKPGDIPEDITIDVSELAIGDVVSVEDLPTSDKFEYVDEPDKVLVTIVPPTSDDVESQLPDEDAEPELVDGKAEEESE